MLRRVPLVIAVALPVLAAAGWLGWRSIPYEVPPGQQARATSVTRQTAYVERYWEHPNAAYGDLGGTDCVNFTSQALHARGWPMTEDWGHADRLGRDTYTSAWVSSTAFMRWLTAHPELATPLGDDRRDEVRVGDVVQFDWDGSGDRDHTAVVTRTGGGRVEVAQHSPAGLHEDVDRLIDEHGGGGTIHWWRLRR